MLRFERNAVFYEGVERKVIRLERSGWQQFILEYADADGHHLDRIKLHSNRLDVFESSLGTTTHYRKGNDWRCDPGQPCGYLDGPKSPVRPG
jgi:hypothetical protein